MKNQIPTVPLLIQCCLGMALTGAASDIQVIKDVSYGPHARNVMDLYLPMAGPKPRPLVICIHGGGWAGGDKQRYAWLGDALAREGFATASITYRFAPAFRAPAQMDDVQRAVRWLRKNAAQYGLDPERVGAIGGSAGGHLASYLALTETRDNSDTESAAYSSRVQCVVDCYGPVDLVGMMQSASAPIVQGFIGKPLEGNEEDYRKASPVSYVRTNPPPFLIVHGTRDVGTSRGQVPLAQSIAFHEKLLRAGGQATLLKLEGAGHGFTGNGSNPYAQETLAAAVKFFKKHLAAEPIRLHPDNPHYFLWRGKPAILVTSGEHYGAVLNLDFDYRRYLDELRAHRFNLTRVFAGTYREVPGSFNITGNTLAPAAGRFVCPWARSQTPGASDGGNKFDLTKWDEGYFARLKDFLHEAGEHNVVVELVLFCTMYDETLWKASPMHERNNINGVGALGPYEVFSGKDKILVSAQEALARKLAEELNLFDNLYFEVCNEPYERGGLTKAWKDRVISSIVEAEAALPKKHLIAQGFPPAAEPVEDLNPRVSVLNFHAAKPAAAGLNLRHERVVAFDETGGSDRSDRKYRTEGWEWLLAGGAVYDHLDFSFTTSQPDGTSPLPDGTPGGGGPELRRQLRILKEFVESFDFLRMVPNSGAVKNTRINQPEPGEEGKVSVLAKPGQAYAIYVNGGTRAELELDVRRGTYKAEWVSTRTGRIEKSETFQHAAGNRTLVSPDYTEDIALRIMRVVEQHSK